MSLRAVLLSTLSVVVCLFLVGSWLIQRTVLQPTFDTLEAELAVRDLGRVRSAILNELGHLDAFATDWGAWDDTYAFVAKPDDAYIAANLTQSYFASGNFSAAYYLDLGGRVVWGMARDPDHDYAEKTIAEFAGAQWSLAHPLLANQDLTKGVSGILLDQTTPLLVAARPIIKSTKEGPMRGWIVLAKQVTDPIVERLRAQTGLQFDLQLFGSAGDPDAAAARTALAAGAAHRIEYPDDRQLVVYGKLDDVHGRPALLLRVPLPRDVSGRGADALAYALVSTSGASLGLLLLLVFLLGRQVVRPIARLTEHAVALGKSDDLLARLHSDRRDEIGVLAREFDGMVDRLVESRSKLLEVARAGGRSEVATSVLHSVGNVLNSVNVSKDVLRSRMAAADEKTLGKLFDLLQAHQEDLGDFITRDPSGRHLPRFLTTLVGTLQKNHAVARSEFDQLDEGIGHLRALVAAQQEFAGADGVAEFTSMPDLVELALRVARARFTSLPVTIERDCPADLPLLKLEKHKVLEALVNLVSNACEATAAAPGPDRRVTVRLRLVDPNLLRLQVEDNGVGISADNLGKLFTYGFTTKPGGHGFGLHASANTIRAIGGQLSATSAGVGKGACFTMDVPYAATTPRSPAGAAA